MHTGRPHARSRLRRHQRGRLAGYSQEVLERLPFWVRELLRLMEAEERGD
jgi:hypothetical protein